MKTKFLNIPKHHRTTMRKRARESMVHCKVNHSPDAKRLTVSDDGSFVYHFNLKTWLSIQVDVTKEHGMSIEFKECFDNNGTVVLDVSRQRWAIDLFETLTKQAN